LAEGDDGEIEKAENGDTFGCPPPPTPKRLLLLLCVVVAAVVFVELMASFVSKIAYSSSSCLSYLH